MNFYGLTLPKGANIEALEKFQSELDRLRRSAGSQAGHRSRRRSERDLVTRKRLMGCRVSESEQKQLHQERGRRKSQRRKDRKAGIRV